MLTLKNFFAMRTGKATGCFVLLATGCLGLWDRVLPVASPGTRAKFIYCDGVARGNFLSGLSFSNMQLSAVFPFVGGVLSWFFCGGRKGSLCRSTHACYRFYGEIEGRIIGVGRARSGAVRVTLDQVELENISKSNTHHKVRLSISDAPAAQLLTPQGA